MSETNILELLTPPFKYKHGYIFDADGRMVADMPDDEVNGVLRVRGWARLGNQFGDKAAHVQDEIGHTLAAALTDFWYRNSKPALRDATALCDGCGAEGPWLDIMEMAGGVWVCLECGEEVGD